MNTEMQSIIHNLTTVIGGEPWYGRAVIDILEDVDPAQADKKPTETAHSATELIYHMLTWSEFTLKRIEEDKEYDLSFFEKNNWREIDPSVHTWKNGVTTFKNVQKKITGLLQEKNDDFLEKRVDYRDYNFRFLLNGLAQHHIYHAGQIVYFTKLNK